MIVIFRVDGDEIIGSGHIMRCLSLAKSLSLYNVKIKFILTNNIFEELIEKEGFACEIIEGFSRDFTIKKNVLFEKLDTYEDPLVIVDSYYITKQFVTELNSKYKVFLISDKNETSDELKQIGVLNYNLYMNEYKSTIYRLNGTKYALLRDEFYDISYKKKNNEILILSGGSDPFNALSLFVSRLLKVKELYNFSFTIITTNINPNLGKLKNIEKNNKRVNIVVNTKEISKYMARARVAISAGGNTIYELCACGVECITYSYSDVQISLCEAFEQYYPYIGDIRDDIMVCLTKLVGALPALLQMDMFSQYKTLQGLCDGKGSEREAKHIAEYFIYGHD